jgi:hypothetical protein
MERFAEALLSAPELDVLERRPDHGVCASCFALLASVCVLALAGCDGTRPSTAEAP